MVFDTSSTLAPFSKSFEKFCVVAACEPLHEEIVVQLVSDVGIWKIVAHISFKLYSVAPGSFSTASTEQLTVSFDGNSHG